MSHKYLRMTIDVAIFDESRPRLTSLAKHLVKEGGTFGVGEAKAREFMEFIKSGDVEIDEIRDVEDHS